MSWNLYVTVVYVTVSGLTLHLFLYFLDTFFKRRAHPAITALILAITCAGSGYVLVSHSENGIINLTVNAFMAVAVSFLYSMKWYDRVTISLALSAMLSICEYTTISLETVLFDTDRHFLEDSSSTIVTLFFSRFLFLVLLAVIRLAKRKFIKSNFHRSLMAMIVIPASSIAVILLNYKYVAYTDELSLALSMLSLVCYATLIVYNILIFDWIKFVSNGLEKDAKLAAASELIAMQSQQYEDMIAHNDYISRLRHDQKNFILGILSELEQENYDAIKASLKKEIAQLNESSLVNYSQGIIGAVVEHKKAAATERGIKIESSLSAVKNIQISPIDLSVILGNAIDNAIEATEKVEDPEKKVVLLNVSAPKGTIVITIKNPVSDTVDVRSLTSTKDDGDSHGFGIISMKKLAEKYCGEVFFSCENNEFKTNIVLRNHLPEGARELTTG